MGADNNIYTPLAEYVVWQEGETPQTGFRVKAKSAFDARRRRAEQLGLAGATTLMARRADFKEE